MALNLTSSLTAAGFLAALQRLNAGAHVALAVSGGGDSMGLLALAASAKNLPDAPRFSVLTIDHGLRPEAAAEAAQVAAACQKLGLPHEILTADEKLGGSDIQQKARELRYRLMGAWCAAQGASLVLAHHREDQAETVLMRLARGSGVDGLAGMAAHQTLHMTAGALRLIRPFLDTPQADLRALAVQADLPMSDDPSNEDRRFERVRWRQLMPQLAAQGLDAEKLTAMARTMRQTSETLNRRLHGWLDDVAQWHDYGVLRLPRDAFLALPHDHQSRLLSQYVRYFGGLKHPVKRHKTERLRLGVSAANHGAMTLGGVALRWRRDAVFLGREAAACPHMAIAPSDNAVHWDRRFALQGDALHPISHIGPLGAEGVQAARDNGQVFDDAVPAAYFAALPAVYGENKPSNCPLLDGQENVQALNIAAQGFTRDILGQGW